MEIRCFFKPKDINEAIKGPSYELVGRHTVVAGYNLQPLTLGFEMGSGCNKLLFRPVDPTRVIVMAIENGSNADFFCVYDHLDEEAGLGGMRNYKAHTSNDHLTDCQADVRGTRKYWSITSEGKTFVFGDVTLPADWPFETWRLSDADALCAFVAGEMTVAELRKHAYFAEREAKKELRREEHIHQLSRELRETKTKFKETLEQLSEALKEARTEAKDAHAASESIRLGWRLARKRSEDLIDALTLLTTKGRWPYVKKGDIIEIISSDFEE